MFTRPGMSWTTRLMFAIMIGFGLMLLVNFIGGLGSFREILLIVLVVLLIVVLLFEQGLLGRADRLPVLGPLLSWFMVGRAGSQATQAPASTGAKKLSDKDRAARFREGEERLQGLVNGDAYLERAMSAFVEPFCSVETETPPLALISGPAGVGKRTMAQALIDLLIGNKLASADHLVCIDGEDRERGAGYTLGRARAEAARGGVVLIEDADWLADPEYAPFLKGLADGASDAEAFTTVIVTCAPETARQLSSHPELVGACARFDKQSTALSALDDAALTTILEEEIHRKGYAVEPDVQSDLQRVIVEARDDLREGFRNAETVRNNLAIRLCRKAAETREITRQTCHELVQEIRQPAMNERAR